MTVSLSADQKESLLHLESLARDLNRRINLYSPESAADFRRRHIDHALFIAHMSFPSHSRVVDWGTGGGIPGIPLAIAFPDTEFVLVDAVSKKIQAVRTMARRLGLDNVEAWSGRAEQWDGMLTHSVSRATSSVATLWSWHQRARRQAVDVDGQEWPPGLICLKGGALDSEIADATTVYPTLRVQTARLSEFTDDSYFAAKCMLFVDCE